MADATTENPICIHNTTAIDPLGVKGERRMATVSFTQQAATTSIMTNNEFLLMIAHNVRSQIEEDLKKTGKKFTEKGIAEVSVMYTVE